MRVVGWLLYVALLSFAWASAALLAQSFVDSLRVALIVGAAITLALPVVVDLLAELRRKQRSSPSPLTRLDRLLVRVFALELLLVAGMWGFGSAIIAQQFSAVVALVMNDGDVPVASGDASVATEESRPAPSSSDTAAAKPSAKPPAPIDPQCLDGRYRETLPDRRRSIDDLIDGYSETTLDAFVLGVLDRRYPIGAMLVRGGRKQVDCVKAFTHDRSSAAPVLASLSTVTHECGHMHDLTSGPSYHIAPNVKLSCTKGRLPHTFARSRLLQDSHANDRRPCAKGSIGRGCDSYANTYLTGDSGNQGLDMLVEELVQYIHGLATAHAVAPERYRGVRGMTSSDRDGVLTFLWYLQRYLALARRDHPKVHAALMADACWRRAILTLWGRAWLYLEATGSDPRMSIDADAIEGLVRNPNLMAEIAQVRAADGCAP